MILLTEIKEFCEKSYHLRKRFNEFRKSELKDLEIILNNMPDSIQNEYDYNNWLFNTGYKFKPDIRSSCSIAEVLTSYLNFQYRHKNPHLLKRNRFIHMHKNVI